MRALGFQSQSLPGGASLLKAVFILSNYDNLKKPEILYNNRKEIFKSWKLYKKSCHLIVAHLILRREEIYEDDEDYIYFWLTIARITRISF